jgi:hypothetical protein
VRSLDGFAGGREGVEVGGNIRLVAERGTEVARASYHPAGLRDQPNVSGGSRGGGAPVGGRSRRATVGRRSRAATASSSRAVAPRGKSKRQQAAAGQRAEGGKAAGCRPTGGGRPAGGITWWRWPSRALESEALHVVGDKDGKRYGEQGKKKKTDKWAPPVSSSSYFL